ncbi:MAG: PH domain-containing protein [Cyclobacteriaceae bacterium]|jgi:hypothetical protein|nr:PH domain-containing protein [Cyclobacteriaceae bacterium]
MPSESQYYQASFDRLVKGITAFITLLFGLILFLQRNSYRLGDIPDWPLALSGIFFISLLAVTWLMHIRGYSLLRDSLIIHRPIGNVVIKYQDIESVQSAKVEEMRWTLRTFGNGGLFGIYGKFWNNKYGHMSWYATKRSNFILINMRNGKKVVITPDDMALVEELSSRLTM